MQQSAQHKQHVMPHREVEHIGQLGEAVEDTGYEGKRDVGAQNPKGGNGAKVAEKLLLLHRNAGIEDDWGQQIPAPQARLLVVHFVLLHLALTATELASCAACLVTSQQDIAHCKRCQYKHVIMPCRVDHCAAQVAGKQAQQHMHTRCMHVEHHSAMSRLLSLRQHRHRKEWRAAIEWLQSCTRHNAWQADANQRECSREKVCWVEGEQLMQGVLCDVALHGEDNNPSEQAQHASCAAFSYILGPV